MKPGSAQQQLCSRATYIRDFEFAAVALRRVHAATHSFLVVVCRLLVVHKECLSGGLLGSALLHHHTHSHPQALYCETDIDGPINGCRVHEGVPLVPRKSAALSRPWACGCFCPIHPLLMEPPCGRSRPPFDRPPATHGTRDSSYPCARPRHGQDGSCIIFFLGEGEDFYRLSGPESF
jgi:hypothetical protein